MCDFFFSSFPRAADCTLFLAAEYTTVYSKGSHMLYLATPSARRSSITLIPYRHGRNIGEKVLYAVREFIRRTPQYNTAHFPPGRHYLKLAWTQFTIIEYHTLVHPPRSRHGAPSPEAPIHPFIRFGMIFQGKVSDFRAKFF